MLASQLIKKAKSKATQKRKNTNEWFFKTGPGEYGEGDKFIGLSMPQARVLAKEFITLPRAEIQKLLNSPLHEVRMIGLLIILNQYERAAHISDKKSLYSFYLKNKKAINNWDLVDVSVPKIVGHYMFEIDKKQQVKLKTWAASKNLWTRRIAILSTLYFIRKSELKQTFKICTQLLSDKEDLIHKACGWMLREAGKRDEKALLQFLEKNYQKLPRTMLRYSIEKFPPNQRKAMLKGQFPA